MRKRCSSLALLHARIHANALTSLPGDKAGWREAAYVAQSIHFSFSTSILICALESSEKAIFDKITVMIYHNFGHKNSPMRISLLSVILLVPNLLLAQYTWTNLTAAPFNGSKQDGVFFISKDTGWVVNGSGTIHKTTNGGITWIQQKNSPGTYFRSVAFINDQIGFAGNIGPNYFPNVTDVNPLYKTIDGGNSWVDVTSSITGVVPTGICAIQAVDANVIYAAGRVGSPPVIIKSVDGGNNWVGTDLSAHCAMILDLYFQSPDTGYVFAGTNANIAISSARILRTTDGGQTWTTVYTSNRPYEITWKAWFPSPLIGYATIQSYNGNTTQRYIAKTMDGGLTWNELPLINSAIREFGVGFINDTVGWVGGELTGYQTLDGGQTWSTKNIGQYANKFSIVKDSNGVSTAYAVGIRVYKMQTGGSTAIPDLVILPDDAMVYPNPARSGGYVSISLEKNKSKIKRAELISMDGKINSLLFDGYYPGTQESPFMFALPDVPAGHYIVRFTDENRNVIEQKLLITG